MVGRVAYTAVEFGGHHRDIVGINEVVAVDVAQTDVVEVAVAAAQTRVVHIRRQVVVVDALVAVDVALDETFGVGHLEDIHLATRTEVADGLADGHLHIACFGIALEGEGLVLAISSPFEGYGGTPILAVGAVANVAFEQCAVAGILARDVDQAVELADGAEVECHFKRHGFTLAILGVPARLLVEVEEFANALSALVFTRCGGLDVFDGKLERVALGLCTSFGPVAVTIFVDGAHFECVGRFGGEAVEGEGAVADGGVDHAAKFHFIIVGIGHGSP